MILVLCQAKAHLPTEFKNPSKWAEACTLAAQVTAGSEQHIPMLRVSKTVAGGGFRALPPGRYRLEDEIMSA